MESEVLGMETAIRTKRKTALGYTTEQAITMTDALNKLLSDYSVHYQKLRNFHWNVIGGDFFDIHEKFEDQYNNAKVAIDDIAERIRVFNHTPLSTMQSYLDTASIKESGTDLSGMEMVKEIIADYHIILESMLEVVEIAIDNGDSGTEDMIKGFIKNMEKDHWMMTAFSSKN